MSAGLSGFSSRLSLGLLGLSIRFAARNLSSFCRAGISVGFKTATEVLFGGTVS